MDGESGLKKENNGDFKIGFGTLYEKYLQFEEYKFQVQYLHFIRLLA